MDYELLKNSYSLEKKMQNKEILLARITTNPEILAGKPIIKGTRLAVEHVLDFLGQGMTTEEIMQEYPQLKKEDILACIIFYYNPAKHVF